MPSRRAATLTTLLALALCAALAGPALAEPIALTGAPLTVYVDELGQLQAVRQTPDGPSGIFFNSTRSTGDAGFFLAFTEDAAQPGVSKKVYGFTGRAGPTGLAQYTPVSRSATTGVGTPVLTQVTKYAVSPAPPANVAEVTQTTTYTNGSQQFSLRWDVKNTSAAPLKLKALAAADFFFDGSDRGTGIYTDGPPRFIGGTNADTGNSGGFTEVTGGGSASPPWTKYQALEYGAGINEVWGKVAHAADSTAPSFDGTVVGEPVDNAGGVEWDQYLTTATAIPAGATRRFELIARSAVPSPLQLTPSNAGSPRGVPVNVTATATNSDGVPYAGRALRYTIAGVNPAAGVVTLDANGQGTITDPGSNAGGDTIIAYVDFNNDGARQEAEPQASSLATFVDQVAPSCTVKVSGDRPGGGGAGKPLKITVSCNESATVKVATTLQVARKKARKSTADAAKKKKKKKKPIKIRLKTTSTVAAPGASVPVRIRISKKVRRKYAGRKVKATVTITATDTSGNVKKVSRSRSIKLAKLKKKKAKKRS